MNKGSVLIILIVFIALSVLAGAFYLRGFSKLPAILQKTSSSQTSEAPNPNAAPPRMQGSSMLPTLKEGDVLNINRSFDKSKLKRGDLVMYKEDVLSDQIYGPKRIIALGGDTLKLLNGDVYLNGAKLNESYLLEQSSTSPEKYLLEGADTIVPNSTVFVMGDNRQHSADSRISGPLDIEKIAGIVNL